MDTDTTAVDTQTTGAADAQGNNAPDTTGTAPTTDVKTYTQAEIEDAITEYEKALVKCIKANTEAERILKYALWVGTSQVLALSFMVMILILARPGSTPTTSFYIVATAWILCEAVSVGTLVVLIVTSLIGATKVFYNWISEKIKRKR